MSISSTDDLKGLKVDWEMKALMMASVYAILKVLGPIGQNSFFINFARLFFIAGNLSFLYLFIYTNYRIVKSASRTEEEKSKAKGKCRDVLKTLFIRSAVIFAIHLRTSLLPPLFISVFMAFFALIENYYYFQVLYFRFPKLFDFIYE